MRAGLPLAGRALRHGWGEVGDFLGGSIRDLLGGVPARAPARALARRRDQRTCEVRRMSLGGGVVMWGRRRERSVRATRVVRARERGLARLRHAAPPAVHRLAPLLRRHRRLPRARRRVGAARGRGARVRARRGRRRARARRAARAAAADGNPELRPRRTRRGLHRRRVRDRGGRRDQRSSRGSWHSFPSALPRARLQPRAPRRTLPLGPLVRARVGRLPGRLRLRSGRGRSRRSPPCSPLPSPCSSRSRSGHSRITCVSYGGASPPSRGA